MVNIYNCVSNDKIVLKCLTKVYLLHSIISSISFMIKFKASGAALLRVIIDADGRNDFSYLEACMRFVPKAMDNNNQPNPIFLSSGGEDYFLSASYFDDGMFKVISQHVANNLNADFEILILKITFCFLNLSSFICTISCIDS